MTSTGFVSMRVVRTLADAVAEAGVPRGRLLRAVQLEEASLQTLDARIPVSKLYELLGQALVLTGDPAFGLHSIERLPSDALNPLAGLVAHASSLRQAFASLESFRSLLGDGPTFALHEAQGKLHVRCLGATEQPLHIRRYLAEVALAGLFCRLKQCKVAEHVELVCFAYEPPEYATEYLRLFDGRVRFGQPATEMRLDAPLLGSAPTHADAELHDTLSALAARRVQRMTDRAPYAVRVHDALIWQRPPRDMTMHGVARKLGVSVRSLRRYLTAEGKTFAELTAGALECLAKRALLDERRTISQTAQELGFADETSFHRAFKRWTGTTPMQYRRAATSASVG